MQQGGAAVIAAFCAFYAVVAVFAYAAFRLAGEADRKAGREE